MACVFLRQKGITRNPEALPFFALVRDPFGEFERVYAERFQPKSNHLLILLFDITSLNYSPPRAQRYAKKRKIKK